MSEKLRKYLAFYELENVDSYRINDTVIIDAEITEDTICNNELEKI